MFFLFYMHVSVFAFLPSPGVCTEKNSVDRQKIINKQDHGI
jgi:hypothetical protein